MNKSCWYLQWHRLVTMLGMTGWKWKSSVCRRLNKKTPETKVNDAGDEFVLLKCSNSEWCAAVCVTSVSACLILEDLLPHLGSLGCRLRENTGLLLVSQPPSRCTDGINLIVFFRNTDLWPLDQGHWQKPIWRRYEQRAETCWGRVSSVTDSQTHVCSLILLNTNTMRAALLPRVHRQRGPMCLFGQWKASVNGEFAVLSFYTISEM